MKNYVTLFMGIASLAVGGNAAAQELVIPINSTNSDIEIIEGGQFDVVNSLIGNTGDATKICLGEVDFGADGEKYKAASLGFANGWGTDGWAILHAGPDFESSVPFTEIPLNEYRSYYVPRYYGANMGFNVNGGVSEGVTVGEGEPLQYTKPVGKQKVYLTFVAGNGNLFSLNFYENEFTEADFANEESGWGGDEGIRLLWPSERPEYADKAVVVTASESQAAVPTGEGTDYPETRVNPDNECWGWTKDGFVADFGSFDFADGKYGQLVVELSHWSQNLSDYLEFYIDEVAEDNLIASLWTGRELRDKTYPLAMNIDAVSGTHKLLVKWVGGSTDVKSVSIYEGTPWPVASECGIKLVDDIPHEDAFHFTFVGCPEGQGNPWNYEILANGQWESKGNVGYTKNGTILMFYQSDGSGIDFGENLYKSIVINHSSDPTWVGDIDQANFTFYVDLDPDMIYTTDDWKDPETVASIIAGHDPIARVRLQGTGSWDNVRHVRGEMLCDVSGEHELYMIYNTPGDNIGANVFDIYLEPGQGGDPDPDPTPDPDPDPEPGSIADVESNGGVSVSAQPGSIVVSAEVPAKVEVYGVNGVQIVDANVSAGTNTYSVASGLYLVKLSVDGENTVSKVIVK